MGEAYVLDKAEYCSDFPERNMRYLLIRTDLRPCTSVSPPLGAQTRSDRTTGHFPCLRPLSVEFNWLR